MSPPHDESGADMKRSRLPGGERPADDPRGRELAFLSLAALGVVYGDIGTSPIYALRESLSEAYGLEQTAANVLGVLSLIFWSLILVISIKYLGFVMRADNRGEGGIIALTALVAPRSGEPSRRTRWLLIAGLFGAALLYGDSMITPAISVLSAIEGLEVATPVFEPYVIPITLVILVLLFAFQSRGTATVGAAFGPVTLIWFSTLAVLGISQLIQNPGVLAAVNPLHALDFFGRNQLRGFLVLSSVFLVVTGGEALYADMGHFGRRPIRVTWFGIVLPALLLNYFGQGAMIIDDPAAARQPFFLMAPRWALYPLVALTTVATVIASQAVISGAFSLTRQAVQLGYLPRLPILHTSEKKIGQIYVPPANWALGIATILLVLGFRTSSSLAHAYGVAVTTDMVFTTILFAFVARQRLGWPGWAAAGLVVVFLTVDLSFWGANLSKIPTGGWFPLVIAAAILLLMTSWAKGRRVLAQKLRAGLLPLGDFVEMIEANPPVRVSGTAVFMTGNPDATPPALLHNLKHNKVLHEQVVVLRVTTEEIPYVSKRRRTTVKPLGENVYQATIRYGFAQDPDVPRALASADELELETAETSYFLGRENLRISREARAMRPWRAKLFQAMSRNALGATTFFRIPPNRVVELGTQVEL